MAMQSLLSILLLCSSCLANPSTASKRGLVYIYSDQPSDLSHFTGSGSDLSWYYNYGTYPSPDTPLSFVPMLHSLPDSSADFLGTIASLLKSSNPPRYVLSFNEPEMDTSVGGSAISPHDAAKAYLSEIAPLRNSTYNHIKVSLPSTSGSGLGIDWLKKFNESCYSMNPKYGCPADFIATHWYGDFGGLASWLSQIHDLFPALPIWITEFADPSVDLGQTQAFFNQSIDYLDNLGYIDRYAWFGTFRADNANGFVGPNVSFLDDGGKLTDLGSWYLGGHATGNLPTASVASLSSFSLTTMLLGVAVMLAVCCS